MEKCNNYLDRYAKHIALKEIGIKGQQKLTNSSVLVVGAGGLGSPAAIYLAASGIGKIGIVDSDVVELSNLQRQILHGIFDVGRPKVSSAAGRIRELNQDVEVVPYQEFLDKNNIWEIIQGYDFVIDCTDNSSTKFLVNDVCVSLEKPFCIAGILQFRGQVMTYIPGAGPCYRCAFREPPKGTIKEQKAMGIAGPLCGIVGSIQAMEAIKYFVGVKELLTGRLLVVDSLSMQFQEVKLPEKRKGCTACDEGIKK